MDEAVLSIIRKYAVKNATEYGGVPQEGAVLGKVLADIPELKKDVPGLRKEIGVVLSEVSKLSEAELKKEMDGYEFVKKNEKTELRELKNVGKKGVVMRMAPFPSGQLHIGRARMAILNDEYVKKYGGKLYLVLDDTAGSRDKIPTMAAMEGIPEDLGWLGVSFHEIIYKSDRLELFYKHGEVFIKKGWAYVCTCDVDVMRENRRNGVACAERGYTAAHHFEQWKNMLDGVFKEGEAVVRLKTDIRAKDPAFRDRVLFRVSNRKHPRVGLKYHVWPLLEFSWMVDDVALGMTHVLRGKDLIMEDRMQEYMWNLLRWEGPEILHHGLLSLHDVKISSSEAAKKIRDGTYSGWSDPRTYSLRSLRRRGFRPEAIRSFILSFGMSMTDITVPIDSLYSENRKFLEKEERRFFVPDPVRIVVSGIPEGMDGKVPRHPDDSSRGQRVFALPDTSAGVSIFIPKKDADAENIRLKGLCNVSLKGTTGRFVAGDHTSAAKLRLPIVQWVLEDSVNAAVVMPDGSIVSGRLEGSMGEYTKDRIFQFERFGFVRIDRVDEKENRITCYFAHS